MKNFLFVSWTNRSASSIFLNGLRLYYHTATDINYNVESINQYSLISFIVSIILMESSESLPSKAIRSKFEFESAEKNDIKT